MTKETIGFYGDSFCARRPIRHTTSNGNTSWVKQLEQEYNLIHVGSGGSNIWDCILYQWGEYQINFENKIKSFNNNLSTTDPDSEKKFYETTNHPNNNLFKSTDTSKEQHQSFYPDIAVFCWTNPSRLFTEERLNITSSNITSSNKDTLSETSKIKAIKIAAQQYYEHLFSWKQNIFEYTSALRFFDTYFLNKVSKKTKIIHFYTHSDEGLDLASESNIFSKHYQFQNGMTLYPSLEKIQYKPHIHRLRKKFSNTSFVDHHECHMDTIEKNNFLCSMVRQSLESYSNGETRDFKIPNFTS